MRTGSSRQASLVWLGCWFLPFNCVNITNRETLDWYAAKGETSTSGWKAVKCTSYDREITLSVRGHGSHDEIGFAEVSFEFQLAFKDGGDFWPSCGQHTKVGPGEFSEIQRWQRFDVDVAGRCGDWLISSRTVLTGGFSAFEP